MEPVQNSVEQQARSSRAPKTPLRGRAANPKAYGRNRISNGSGSALPTQDGRSLWVRIRRDTINAIVNGHLAGADQASETQLLMARRVGTLEAELVFIEDGFARTRAAGGEPDPATLDLYGRLADRQRRLAEPLGWQRSSRPTPGLHDPGGFFDIRDRERAAAVSIHDVEPQSLDDEADMLQSDDAHDGDDAA